MTAPLAGLRVLDFTQYVAGPYCTMLLGDLGAEVVKVERPGSGDQYRRQGPHFLQGESVTFLALNRNKQSLTLDLKAPQAREIVTRLVPTFDVLVENSRPGTMEELGLGYADLREVNRRLIYASISAFGQTGPRSREGGYDLLIQGMTGLMSMTGEPGGRPTKIPIAALDFGSGMFAAIGILSAYIARERTGEGQQVDTSLLDCATSWLGLHLLSYLASGDLPRPSGSASPFFAPYQALRTGDGYILVVGTGGNDAWPRFCGVLGLEPLVDDPRFATNAARVANLDALVELLEQRLTQQPSRYWLERLDEVGVVCGPINTLDQLLVEEQVRQRGLIATVEHPGAGPLQLAGVPIGLSETPGEISGPPPQLGQHTAAVLRSAGYQAAEIAQLAADGVV
jgi:crotonobetainyl-CoA:carnitine CoA-transferase CaiB-like acyl-CoA transferase